MSADRGLIDVSYKLVRKVNFKLNVGTTKENTHISNNDVEQVLSPQQNIFTDAQTDIYLSTEHYLSTIFLLIKDNNVFIYHLSFLIEL